MDSSLRDGGALLSQGKSADRAYGKVAAVGGGTDQQPYTNVLARLVQSRRSADVQSASQPSVYPYYPTDSRIKSPRYAKTQLPCGNWVFACSSRAAHRVGQANSASSSGNLFSIFVL